MNDKVRDYTLDAVDERRASIAENPFQGPDGDEMEIFAEYMNNKRDDFGLWSFWDTVCDLTLDISGIQYNYQQGYYFFYLGHSFGALLADASIMVQWWIMYERLQARRADALNTYTEAYWRAAARANGEEPAEEEEADEEVEEVVEEDDFF